MRVAFAVVLVLAGCNNPTHVSVKLAKLTTWPLTQAEADTLDEKQLAELAERGIALQGSTIAFPELPLVGYWVEVGGQRFMSDENAVVALSAPADAVASIFEDYGSTYVLGTFKIRDVAALPSPARVDVRQVLPPPGEMNPEMMLEMASAGTDLHGQSLPVPYPDGDCERRDITACAPDANEYPCCLDYDNAVGNGVAYKHKVSLVCDQFANANFLQSTCFAWTAMSVCADEAAFGRGPNCWAHHKYRNCQNLDITDFSATPAGTGMVRPGGTTTLKIRNNLPSNDSLVNLSSTLTDSGSMSNATRGAELKQLSKSLWVINHYEEAALRHVEETEVTYTAPPRSVLPAFCTTVDVRVDVVARTFDPIRTIYGITVPRFPVLRHKVFMLQIDCGAEKPPELHLHWKLNENPPMPNIGMTDFDTTAEIDLSPARVDNGSVNYEPSAGTVTFKYIPYIKPASDPCTYSATAGPLNIPLPPPAFLTIASKKGPGNVIFSVGGVETDVILQKECPSPTAGMPPVTTVTVFPKMFPYMQISGLDALGSLEDLAEAPLKGILGGGAGGPSGEWTLSRR
jgi:hypothetical protein